MLQLKEPAGGEGWSHLPHQDQTTFGDNFRGALKIILQHNFEDEKFRVSGNA
jgi:hypothetical protein